MGSFCSFIHHLTTQTEVDYYPCLQKRQGETLFANIAYHVNCFFPSKGFYGNMTSLFPIERLNRMAQHDAMVALFTYKRLGLTAL